jgi:hypothetical protein
MSRRDGLGLFQPPDRWMAEFFEGSQRALSRWRRWPRRRRLPRDSVFFILATSPSVPLAVPPQPPPEKKTENPPSLLSDPWFPPPALPTLVFCPLFVLPPRPCLCSAKKNPCPHVPLPPPQSARRTRRPPSFPDNTRPATSPRLCSENKQPHDRFSCCARVCQLPPPTLPPPPCSACSRPPRRRRLPPLRPCPFFSRDCVNVSSFAKS